MPSCGLKQEFQCKSFGFGFDHPQVFVLSECGPLILYPIWTLFWLLYHITWLALEPYFIIVTDFEPENYFIFLTNWGYILLSISNLVDVIVTWYVYCNRKDIVNNVKGKIPTPCYLQFAWFLFETSNVIALSVTIGFYSALEPSIHPPSIEFHAINSVYVILNLFVCAKPVRLLHVIYPIIFAVIYITFSIIYQLGGDNDEIYPILDWTTAKPTAITVAVLVVGGIPIIQLIVFAFYKLRLYVSGKCCGSPRGDDDNSDSENRTSPTNDFKV